VRIVFDTNVLFAAFVAHGVCAGLYEECLLDGRIVVSQFILQELREKLCTKAGLNRAEADEVVAAVCADAEVVAVQRLSKPICRDADDDWIPATALAAKVDALVTGDKDLLVLRRVEAIPILTPRDCIAFLRNG